MTEQTASTEPLTTIRPQQARRWVAIAILWALSGLLIWVAIGLEESSLVWRAILVLFGGVVLLLANKLRMATQYDLVLYKDRLEDGAGRVVCNIDDIEKLDRGVFAFKPSNGFLIRTKSARPRGWAPGLWWRVGRFIGVGGVTPAGQTKVMAEFVQTMLLERQGKLDDL
jgi:hypothetical protein